MSDDDRNSREKRSRSRSSDERRGTKRRFDGDRHEMRMIIRAKDAGAVIGRGGENVKRLRQEYKASITVTDSRTPERLIIVSGDEEGLVGIITDIGKALFENAKERSSKDITESELKFLIHHSQAGCVIGKAGCKLKELRKDLDVDIKVYPECCPRSTERLIMVTGKPDLCAKAMVHMSFMLKTWPPRGVVDYYEPSNYDESLVPDYGGYYEDDDNDRRGGGGGGRRSGRGGGGGGGGGRRDRGGRGGRDRDYDRRGGGGYGGRDRGRDRDRDYDSGPSLNGLTLMLNSVKTTQQVSIPAELAGVIIGKSGTNIRRIRNETGADVDLDDAGGGKNDRIITIQGTAEQIANAQYLLQMSVKQHLAKNS